MRKGFWWKDGYAGTAGLAIKCIGEGKEKTGAHADGEHSHDFWVLDFTFENFGECPAGPNGAWIPREPGMAQLIRPNARYYNRKVNHIDSHAAYIGFFNGEAAGFDKLVGKSGVAVFRDPRFMIGEGLARGAAWTQTMGEYSYWRVLGVLCDIAGLLHAARPQAHDLALIDGWEPIAPSERSLDKRLQKYLSINLDRRLSLKAMADAMTVSVSSLTHTYAALAGESPQETHLRMRLEWACEWLRMGDSVKEIAGRLGFFDVHHFTKVFKTKIGLPPAEFRAERRSVGTRKRRV